MEQQRTTRPSGLAATMTATHGLQPALAEEQKEARPAPAFVPPSLNGDSAATAGGAEEGPVCAQPRHEVLQRGRHDFESKTAAAGPTAGLGVVGHGVAGHRRRARRGRWARGRRGNWPAGALPPTAKAAFLSPKPKRHSKDNQKLAPSQARPPSLTAVLLARAVGRRVTSRDMDVAVVLRSLAHMVDPSAHQDPATVIIVLPSQHLQ